MFTGIVAATGTVIALEPGPGTHSDTAPGSPVAEPTRSRIHQDQSDDLDGHPQPTQAPQGPQDIRRLRIRAGQIAADLPPGGSLAVDGVCLTSTLDPDAPTEDTSGGTLAQETSGQGASVREGQFVADVMGETLARTTLGDLVPGATVNLERCLPAGGRLDGHIVQGHIDATGVILVRTDHDAWETMRISIPEELAPLLAQKGAIAVDGVSLTVTQVSPPAATGHWFEIGLIPATLSATGLGAKKVGQRVNLEADVMAKYAARLAAFNAAERWSTRALDPNAAGRQK